MPNRILKDSICTSETIDALSTQAEVFFYRLLVQCDDYGRTDARPVVLLARCFPLRIGQMSAEDISGWLVELVNAGLVWEYEREGLKYLQVTTWGKHQQIRAKRSKFPSPLESDSNGNQMLSDDSNSTRESESESESESEDTGKPPKPKTETESLPVQARVFVERGGKFPSGNLADGTPKRERAIAYMAERVKDNPASLELWGRVVEAYCMQWSSKSYTVMVSDYYERGRVPGESTGAKKLEPVPPKATRVYQ